MKDKPATAAEVMEMIDLFTNPKAMLNRFIEMLKQVLSVAPIDQKAIILQTFISEFGPIPDEHGDDIRKLMGNK